MAVIVPAHYQVAMITNNGGAVLQHAALLMVLWMAILMCGS